jgi:Fe-S-cluster containining protein
MSVPVVPLDHPRFRRAEVGVFVNRLVADCMSHRCAMHETGGEKLDACCQYGCDVDLFERDAILARADDIRPVLRDDARALPWFDEREPEEDPDTRSGIVVRTSVLGGGCIFLAHDRRGCAIHRAGLERGWDFRAVKPSVCQLFPLSYTSDEIVVSDDYVDYSCAYVPDAPTLYRVGRDALAYLFGEPLVRAMDAAEQRVLARRLPRAPIGS